MPIGISIDEGTINIVSPEGTVRQRNEFVRIDAARLDEDAPLQIQTEQGSYVIGTAVEYASEAEAQRTERLFDRTGTDDDELHARALEALIADALSELDSEVETLDRVGYVTRQAERSIDVPAKLSDLGYDVVEVDPGMAVCYDGFESPVTGIGIFVGDGTAVATLAVRGIPVSTAAVDYRDRWYDVSRVIDRIRGDGPVAEWVAIQYESILADLAIELTASAPRLSDDVDVALGGSGTPVGIETRLTDVLESELGYSIGSVMIAENPIEAPARGALVAAEGKSEKPPATPAFAANVGFVSDLASGADAVDTFENVSAIQRAKTSISGGVTDEQSGDSGTSGHVTIEVGDEESSARGVDERSRLERHRDRLAHAHEILVDRLQEEDATRQLEELRTALEAELQRVEEASATATEVAELEQSLGSLEGSFAELEDDLSEVRAVISGVDDEASFEISSDFGGIESLAVDALKEDITDVESSLSDRIERLWSELDDINDDLTNVRAGVGDIADIESDLNRAKTDIEKLSSKLEDLRRSIAGVSESLDDVERRSATTEQVDSLQAEIHSVESELGALEDQLRNLDVAEPEQVNVIERDLSALQDSVVNQANRLEGVERTTSDLEDRIGQAFKDTAKAEAVSAVQADVSRMRNTVSSASERAQNAAETAEELQRRLDAIDSVESDLDQMERRLDVVVENSITRAEVDQSVSEFKQRVLEVEKELDDQDYRLEQALNTIDERIAAGGGGVADRQMLQIIALGLGAAGAFAGFLAFEVMEEQPEIGLVFAALMIGPAAFLLYRLT